MRLYEFSKKFGFSNKELMALLNEHGFEISSHMALLSDQALAFLEKQLLKKEEQKQQPQAAPVQPVKPERIIAPVSPKKMEKQIIVEKSVIQPGIVIEAMTVGEFADRANKPINEIILSLLRQGIAATKNQLISEKTVAQLAQAYNIPVITAQESKPAPSQDIQKKSATGSHKRPPVVVVIGHVDHGKTTLLDFIRKTRVAAKEKGGITQHIGAYAAITDQGAITFLDTPGHEAFSMMRVRGLKIADIAILMVAADDGIMPQTVEAIKAAKRANLPIIVALNKIDKASALQLEAAKRGLAQYDLLPEEWGGQTVVMPISAKLGTGVKELLDVIVLQSELMELTTDYDVPARGFVLESRIEKGRGPVATVICQQGILKIGDYFICGKTRGRVNSLMDSVGARVKEASPSMPVSVAGFPELPEVGEIFEVVTAAEFKTRPVSQITETRFPQRQALSEDVLNLFIKTDTVSSKEALVQAIQKMAGKAFKEFNILNAAVGAITENDVMLAADTNGFIYGLHTKIEPNAATLAQKMQVPVKLFDVIYKMLEDLQIVAEQGRPVKKVLKKIGEAVVLKVFDIKNLGVIAGAQVKSGRFTRDGKVVVWRGKYKVGEGTIKSLQRDKKAVKEVHTGFECAFMVDGFTEWQVDDRVDCMQEVEAV